MLQARNETGARTQATLQETSWCTVEMEAETGQLHSEKWKLQVVSYTVVKKAGNLKPHSRKGSWKTEAKQ
jgi:hypothetical protein